jgi:hypothetical protein
MSTQSPAKTVGEALEAVESWRSEEDARRIGELGEVAQEIQSLEAAMENLRQQLEALHTFQTELEAKGSEIAAQVDQRTYQGIFEVLQMQAAAVEQREREGLEAAKARSERLPELIAERGLADVLKEYEQFKTAVEPTLKHLPESYKAAMLDVHHSQEAKLRAAIAELGGAPDLPADELAIDLVYAIDAPEGAPELLVVVVPVADSVQSGWVDREGGLQTMLAARVAEAIYRAAADAAFMGAQALSGGHLGLLAVELELVGADASLADNIRSRIASVPDAPELKAAKVSLTVREIDMDHLLPPEDEEAADGE